MTEAVTEPPPGGRLLGWLPAATGRAGAALLAAPLGAVPALLPLHLLPLPDSLVPVLSALPLAAAGLAGGVAGGLGAVLLLLLAEAMLLMALPDAARPLLLAGALSTGLLAALLAGLLRRRLEAERRLHAWQRQAERLAGTGRWRSLPDGGMELSPAAWALLGRPAEAAPISTGRFYTLLHPEDVAGLRATLAGGRAQGGPLRAEFRALRPGGGTRWLELTAEPQPGGGHQGLLLDIDARKQARLDCDAALSRQERLNRELVHRVRNNFQLMASLLRLQQRQAVPEAVPALASALRRVQAMALMHADLYPAAADGTVRLETYLPGLARAVIAASPHRPAPRLEVEASPLAMATDRALLLGLALCEALDNALRHAWPAGRSGSLSLRLTLGTTEAELMLQDDGRGLPTGLAFGQGGLGHLVLQSCARQLEGSLALEAGPPARLILRFPRDAEDKAPPGNGRD
ncbi:sensor histidine kinase [Pseudoroseomonas cervicalis]|uniref:sensor histidine kinase n=1 Tax=Teichococcus cervicalis TaxID=204525 RepID=UPI0022F1BC16|nr:histidine kinase dimerization/phosphoacceptor domain -containing protein [Pseudoroseomonas cervicalis]WBV41727.1 PAS domain-containing protein [Pseudoroseomonas cervicalis]